MDSDTASHAEQPGWYRLFPVLVLIVGLLLTYLLWAETRQTLVAGDRSSAFAVHEVQVRQLETRLEQHEQLLQMIARNPETTALDLLTELPAWRGLIRLTPGPEGKPGLSMSHFADQIPETVAGNIMQPAFWETLPDRLSADQRPLTTPHFRVDGTRLQGLTIATGSGSQQEFLVSLYAPEVLVRDSFANPETAPLHTRIIDLQQHENQPIVSIGEGSASGTERETTIRAGDRQWLVRSQYSGSVPLENGRLLLNGIAVGGSALSLALALLSLQLVRYHRLNRRRIVHLDRLLDRDRRALENKRIEKEVMSRALSDSEQRTRDFIQLGGGIGFELDDEHAIGYVSPQVQPVLGRAPSDLAGLALTALLPESEHQRLTDAVNSSRRERTITRLDTLLEHSDGTAVSVRVQICTVCDALSHCQGFRAVAWPR